MSLSYNMQCMQWFIAELLVCELCSSVFVINSATKPRATLSTVLWHVCAVLEMKMCDDILDFCVYLADFSLMLVAA